MRLVKLADESLPPHQSPPSHPTGHRRRPWLVAGLVGLLVVVVGTSVDYWWQRRLVPPPIVFLAPVTRGPVAARLRLIGTLEPIETRTVTQPSAGRATEVSVRVGDRVVVGQVLARFDPLAQRVELARAESRLVAAEAQAFSAELALSGVLRTPPDGTEELENARALAQTKLATIEAELAARTAAYRLARRHLGERVVRSPIAGAVIARHVEPGQTVAAGAPVVVIGAGSRGLTLVAEAPERELARVSPGQLAKFTVPAFPGRTFEGRVVRALPLRGPEGARHFPIVLDVPNEDLALTFGMTAEADLDTGRAGPVFRVPLAALSFGPGAFMGRDEPAIWVGDARGAGLVRTPVEVGATDGTFAEVRGPGLTEGAMVAVALGRAPRP